MEAARLWRLHLAVLVIAIVAQFIGIQEIPIGIGAILLLPLLYAFLFGVLLNPNVIRRASAIIRNTEVQAASPLIVVAIMPFIAKFGTTIGPSIEEIIEAGPALLLQELGNLGTVALAFPIAVWLLRMGREVIGATFSVAREPNIAIIADRYGLKSPEGAGVMGVYVVGTLFGTLIFAVMASILATVDILDPEALAMACGVGSGSMMASCTGALSEALPAMSDTIVAMSGASNLLTYATGMYLSLFVALPLVEWLYSKSTAGKAVATPQKEA
ncbi:DUF3100 domain-containing protein [Actinobacteria bacterium YIM 96077]|uniref:DUF3100 domain-containing protein n=2 Tax=Phytoactinopolyspora halophila TaxID=1981511 RepID=A0A329R335_9ACTN|nr:DUF3100 domain-containing protein [Actinobacteria bacterium YIM 96077]RAW18950.1 DUF3100 domain-containing protein [Phytoactinopolyspora halophila]